jgi:hypothetical protein
MGRTRRLEQMRLLRAAGRGAARLHDGPPHDGLPHDGLPR